MKTTLTLRMKITLILVFIFLSIIVPSMLILFERMNNIILDSVQRIDQQWVQQRMKALDNVVENMIMTISSFTEDDNIEEFFESDEKKLSMIDANSYVRTAMKSALFSNYVNKIVFFDKSDGTFFEYNNRANGDIRDPYLIMDKEEFKSLEFTNGTLVKTYFSKSINNNEPVIAAFSKIRNTDIYIYTELNSLLFEDIFSQKAIDNLFLASKNDMQFPEKTPIGEFSSSSKYEMNYIKSSCLDLYAIYFNPQRAFKLASSYGVSTALLIMVAAGVLSFAIGALMTKKITKPIQQLNDHMLYLTKTNDYGKVNKDIEQSSDELSTIGKTVNKMSVSIKALLDGNEKLYEEKKASEIAMLNMQINPHFLYNTLESIYFMANIQRAKGIADMSQGLISLLRNMAKGNEDHITLSEELNLVKDYDKIQQVRYMGMYDIHYDIDKELLGYRIIKFTLPPLIENAIFHGIEPKGEYGTIRITAHKDERFLYIHVEDDGVGMDSETISEIFKHRSHEKTNMTGVGIVNVDERLKLVYGKECGLKFESEENKGTKVEVELLLEE